MRFRVQSQSPNLQPERLSESFRMTRSEPCARPSSIDRTKPQHPFCRKDQSYNYRLNICQEWCNKEMKAMVNNMMIKIVMKKKKRRINIQNYCKIKRHRMVCLSKCLNSLYHKVHIYNKITLHHRK